MAFLKVSEFAGNYDVTRNNVYTYAKRKKLVIIDGIVDTTNAVNQLFIQKLESKSKDKRSKELAIVKKKDNPKPEIIEESKDFKQTSERVKGVKIESEKSKEISSNFLFMERLRAQKIQAEIKGLELKNKIEAGELISMDYAGKIINIYLRSIATTIANYTENFTVEMCNTLQADRVVMAKLRGDLKKTINESLVESVKAAVKDLEASAKNYKPDNN